MGSFFSYKVVHLASKCGGSQHIRSKAPKLSICHTDIEIINKHLITLYLSAFQRTEQNKALKVVAAILAVTCSIIFMFR